MRSIVILLLALAVEQAFGTICTSENQLQCYADENPFIRFTTVQTSAGRVIPSVLASKTAGKNGPVLLQDYFLIEKIQRSNREQIPARMAHSKGAGAFGTFKVTKDVSKYTKANFLQPGKVTKVVARFSTQVGELGSADTSPDAKGFAVKFYTDEGIYDFTGLNIPVFAQRDAMFLPDLVHARKKNPVTHQLDLNMFWDIGAERPESTLFVLHFFSKTAFVKSYRQIDGHAIHTFKLVNKQNKPTFAKLHLIADIAAKSYFNTTLDALMAGGIFPEYLTKDLYDSIAVGNYPTWTLNLQLMTYEQAKTYRYNIFDSTKFWNTTEFPLTPVGKLTLDRNPTNFFSDVEQAAYAPSHLVPGIEPTPDRLLEARLFAYRDAHLYRLGINHDQIPVNRCPLGYRNYERDGTMNAGINNGDGPNYYPNTFNGPSNNQNPYYEELPFEVNGSADRYDVGNEDNFSQSQAYFNSLTNADQDSLASNIAFAFIGVNDRIRNKAINKLFAPTSPVLVQKINAALLALQTMQLPSF